MGERNARFAFAKGRQGSYSLLVISNKRRALDGLSKSQDRQSRWLRDRETGD
jgi:hypothetical protein